MKRLFRYIVSGVFAVSASMKLLDFENTTMYFKGLLGIGFKSAQSIIFVAILVEFFVAYSLPLQWQGETVVRKAAMAILVLFLVISTAMAFTGVENCGCFGTVWISHPWISVAKNSVLLIMLTLAGHESRERGYA